jgi:peptide-methionine (R)-S-oxide reductase
MLTRKARRKGSEVEYEVTKTEDEWKTELPPDRYDVLRRAGTEPAWSGELLHVDGEGVFHCAACDAELFDTDAKFESGSGWPSFDRAKSAGTIVEHSDRSFGMARTEILCARCGSHLGHVFPDGPTDSGQRYCVNSLSLTYEQNQDDTTPES